MRFVFLLVFCGVSLHSVLHSAEKVRLLLKSGGSVTGLEIKRNAQHHFIDLGFDVIRVPVADCSKVERLNQVPSATPETSPHLYREQSNGLARGLKELVDELGEAVVMIRTPIGLGSGFLIHPDGYVVTNDHVVAGERKVSITQFSQSGEGLLKKNFDNVRIVATGGNLDLALLKIEGQGASGFPVVPLGHSTELNQGERVFAIGSPLGLERSVSEGIVSLRNRIISNRIHIQTTAEISPGNSGGPLFNYRGEVVGVNNMKVISQGAEGLGFSIPVQTLKTFLQNRDAYAFDPRNPNAGFRYLSPPSAKIPPKTQ